MDTVPVYTKSQNQIRSTTIISSSSVVMTKLRNHIMNFEQFTILEQQQQILMMF
jgi:hypothetical protein